MKKLIPAVFAALAVCLAGCVPSLHPIYTPDQVRFDEGLVGTWTGEDSDESWVFTSENQDAYGLVYTDSDGKEGRFEVHRTEADGVGFLDLYPVEPNLDAACLYRCLLVPVHTFMTVEREGDRLTLAVADLDWLDDYLEEHPDALAHEKLDDGFLLTAQPQALRAFFGGLVKEGKGFGAPMRLTRQAAAEAGAGAESAAAAP